MTGEEGLTIAQMARETGVSEHTLRYYERVGLIQTVERTAGDQRRYREADIEGVKFLLRLRETGMSIAKMREYAGFRAEGEATVEARIALLREHEVEVKARIRKLERNRQVLENKINIYQSFTEQKQSRTIQKENSMKSAATTREQRFEAGARILARIDGAQGQGVLEALADIAPELGHQIVAYGFGEIYSRSELDFRSRELLTIGVLASLGGCEPQLEVHINAALNVGLSPDEIIEAFLHTSVYAGFPRALNAVFVAKKVFIERGLCTLKTESDQSGGEAQQSAPAEATS